MATTEELEKRIEQLEAENYALEVKIDTLTKEKAALAGQVAGLKTERNELAQLIQKSPVQQRKILEQIEAIDAQIAAKEAEAANVPEGLTLEEQQAVRAVRQDAILDLKNERERLRLLIVGENA